MNPYPSHLNLVILQLDKEAKRAVSIMYHTTVHVLRQSQPLISSYEVSMIDNH